MKKVLAILLVLVMMTFSACNAQPSEQAAQALTADATESTGATETTASTNPEPTEQQITAADYVATPLGNVTKVYGYRIEGSLDPSPVPTEDTVGVCVETICPYCKAVCEVWTIWYEDIPESEWGNSVITLTAENMCDAWDTHDDTVFDDFYECSVMLTLTEN